MRSRRFALLTGTCELPVLSRPDRLQRRGIRVEPQQQTALARYRPRAPRGLPRTGLADGPAGRGAEGLLPNPGRGALAIENCLPHSRQR